MFIKVFAVIGFLAVASAADLSVGDGKLIFERNVTASPAVWRQVRTLTVNATKGTNEVISRVVVIDKRPEKDGEATVINGGVGWKNVTLELKSPAVFRGLNFYVQVFAAERNVIPRLPYHPNLPKPTGDDTKNRQMPKDLNVNEHSNQKPKSGNNTIVVVSKPLTNASKDGQQKINPALVGKNQTRLNSDTQNHKTKDLTPVTPVKVNATKDIKVNENANKTVKAKIDENWKKAVDSIFKSNSTPNNKDTKLTKMFVAGVSAADLSVGGGKLIFKQNVTASPAIWKQVRTITVNASKATNEVISRVVVIDNRPENDGEATVINGGVGKKNVTLELKSPAVFRGFDFYVQVFAAEKNVKARLPNHPKPTGDDTKKRQMPKDLNVNEHSNQKPKSGNNTIVGVSKPMTNASKDIQQKINPALVGKDQTRLINDTQNQKTKDLTPVLTPVKVNATKDIKVNENANKTLPKKLANENHTKPKSEVSSITEKFVEQEKNVPRIVTVTSEVSSNKLTTKLPENVKSTQ